MAEAFLDSSSAGYQHRARRLIFVVVLTFVMLTLRLAYLQFVEGAELRAISVRNFIRTVRLPADRGTIYDRNGKPLATNRPSFDLYVTPAYVSDIDGLLDGLEDVLDLDALDRMQLQERIEQPRGMWRFRAIRVSKDIDRKRVALAEGLRARIDGISIRTRYQREYPMGEVGAHLIGYLGRPRRANSLGTSSELSMWIWASTKPGSRYCDGASSSASTQLIMPCSTTMRPG